MKSRVPSSWTNMTFALLGFSCLAFNLPQTHHTFDISFVQEIYVSQKDGAQAEE